MRQSTLSTPTSTNPRSLGVFLAAGVAGLVGASICFDASPGLNWLIWTVVVAAELLVFASGRGTEPPAALTTTLALAILAASGAVVTTDVTLGFIFITVVLLLAFAARLAAGVPLDHLAGWSLALVPVDAALHAAFQVPASMASALHAFMPRVNTAILRGICLALPVVVIFGALLAGADPTLSSWVRAVTTALETWISLPRLFLFVVLDVVTLGTLGVIIREDKPPVRVRSGQPIIGDTERRIIIYSVVVLFGLFLILQASYLFGNRPVGMTYAAYLHQGFGELTVVASLSMALVATLHHGRRLVGLPWATLLLVAEVLGLVFSALHRLTLYEQAYGFTGLRIWVAVYMVAVAASLGIVAWELCRYPLADASRVARRTMVLAVLTVIALAYGNADAWAIRWNVDRFHATGRFDASYLMRVSFDAVPSALDAASILPPACVDEVRRTLSYRVGRQDSPWYEWNARRARALRAVQSIPPMTAGLRQSGVCGGFGETPS